MRYQFIAQHHKQYSVSRQCAVLGVSRSAYYAWVMRQQRGLSSRAQANQKLRCWIEAVFLHHQGRYGRARLDAELRQAGWVVSSKRITRLLQELGLRPRQSRPPRPKRARGAVTPSLLAGNLLNRNFAPSMIQGTNRVWCSDITYLPTAQGWLYLAVVMDLYSRRIIGWSMHEQPTQQLATDALEMAVKQRQVVSRPWGMLHHSDQGCQYTSQAYQKLLRDQGMRCSLSRRGNCHDNAPVESFFATLKKELLHRGGRFGSFLSRDSARRQVFEFIEIYYNRLRRHSTLGYISPCQFEAKNHNRLYNTNSGLN